MNWYRNGNETDKGINVESISSYMYITANHRLTSVSNVAVHITANYVMA